MFGSSTVPEFKFPGILKVPKRLSCANHMTPIMKLDYFSTKSNDVFLKMDDETGFVMSGNKVRKLEYVIQEVLEKSPKGSEIHVITFGAAQSNHCRATVALCRRCSLIPHVFLGEPKIKSDIPDGNLALMKMMGARINFLSKEDEKNVDSIVEKYVENLKATENRSVHVIPVGASIAIGCFGYIEVVYEIIKQFGGIDKIPEYIAISTGSVGTVCGVVLGVQLFKLKTKVLAISVSGNKEVTLGKYKKILDEFNQKYNTKIEIPGEDVFEIIDKYVGEGYGIPYFEEVNTIRELAENHGIIVDPVYTGKGFHGFIEELKAGKMKEDSKLLYVHTGGGFGFLCNRQLENYFSLVEKKK